MAKGKKETVSVETTPVEVEIVPVKELAKKPVPFEKISTDFYEALDELRLEKQEHPDHKALIANAGAYMSKALRAIELVRAL